MRLYKITFTKQDQTFKREVKADNDQEAVQKLVHWYDEIIKVKKIENIGELLNH